MAARTIKEVVDAASEAEKLVEAIDRIEETLSLLHRRLLAEMGPSVTTDHRATLSQMNALSGARAELHRQLFALQQKVADSVRVSEALDDIVRSIVPKEALETEPEASSSDRRIPVMGIGGDA
ncbi:MAG: hypothetical protein UY95_C0024G0002 [Parcubacteria group bacterium GW2011_GWA2_56_7]|nr:MAG: hypothetical protein UY95_C0024G0002 [Parcubacteria group bacterium GW2011_GWA2_56_7]